MAKANAMTFIDKIQMRVDLHQMERLLAGKGVDTGDVDRMIAAKNNRHRAGIQDGANAGLDIGVALDGIGMDDVGIADINNCLLYTSPSPRD